MRWSSPSPNIIALLTSLAVAIGANIFLFALDYFFHIGFHWELLLGNFLVILIFSLVLYQFTLYKFIHNKIKTIYKTIGKPLKYKNEVKDNNKNIMQAVERDVAAWALNKNKQIRELKKLETYRREFVGNVSHELKTPIFNALGYIETLLDGIEDEKMERDYLQKAAANIERLETIVTDLLEVSKFESGQMKLHKACFDIVELTQKVFYQYEIQAEEHDVTLKIEGQPKEVLVFADPNRILQVLENLISNSIKYGKIGGTTIVRFVDLEEQMLIEVSDNGPGIDEKDIPRLFERFFRTDKGRSRKMGGTGLGLSIVKHIIEAHEQTINIRSEPDVETTFGFTVQKYVE
ncbi:MAG: sensor histidine kinase [Chitinophagales bacterium]|nr:sensor histidine kinase [Chitinophagales bacterium]